MQEQNEICRNLRQLSSRGWKPCGADPKFGDSGVEEEADPEGGAEDGVEVEGGGTAGGDGDGDEEADDGSNGSHGETGGEGADHPLTVEGDFAVADVPKGFALREEEERAKERGGGGLRDTTDGGHSEAHDERGNTDNCSTDQKHPAGDTVPPRVVGP